MPNKIHDKYIEPGSIPHVPSLEKNVPVTTEVETEAGGMGTQIHPHGGDESPGEISELSETNMRNKFISNEGPTND